MNLFTRSTCLVLACTGTAGLAAAQQHATAAQAAKAKPMATQKVDPAGSGGQVAIKDPVTGQLRAPEPGELQQLRPSSGSAAQPAVRNVLRLANGGLRADLGDDQMSYVVVEKTADGKLKLNCVQGKAIAEQIVQTPGTGKEASSEQ